MTYDDWWERAHYLGALRTLAASYRQEHDWANDEDTDATEECLRDVLAIHKELMDALGEAPPQ